MSEPSINVGDRRVESFFWHGQQRDCELVYELIDAEMQSYYPERRAIGRGRLGQIRVMHMIDEGAEEFVVAASGMDGGLNVVARHSKLQAALNGLAMQIECVRQWCVAVGSADSAAG